jgi:hypothetical protein
MSAPACYVQLPRGHQRRRVGLCLRGRMRLSLLTDLGREALHAGLILSRGPHGFDALACRVLQCPVEVALAGEDGAPVAAAHGGARFGACTASTAATSPSCRPPPSPTAGGTHHYERLFGLLVASFAGAALASPLGGYPALRLALAAVSALSASLAIGGTPRTATAGEPLRPMHVRRSVVGPLLLISVCPAA